MHPYRTPILAAIALMLVLGACGGTRFPRVLHHGLPGPGDAFPHLAWQMRVRGHDVRLAVCEESGILMLYWWEKEGRLGVFTLDGFIIGRSTVPGTLHAAGFRSTPPAVETLYQNREGRVVILGFSEGKRVSALFEEPYPWAELTQLVKEPRAFTVSDENWHYRVQLELTPGRGVLRVKITGSA